MTFIEGCSFRAASDPNPHFPGKLLSAVGIGKCIAMLETDATSKLAQRCIGLVMDEFMKSVGQTSQCTSKYFS